jgi:type IV pilus assembly protein PilY1
VGNGLAYQVQYYLQRNGVNWTGGLRSFWSDSNGYQREGTIVSGNESLDSAADYVVSGPDTTSGAPAGARANWRCTVPPVPAAGSITFDPSANSACSIVSATNALNPVWDAATLLDAYYDSTTSAGTTAIANIPVQRPYAADASTGTDYGMRYIFTYLTSTPNGASGTGTVTNGTQTDFVWNSASCSATTGAYTLNSTSGFCGAYNSTTSSRTGNYGLLNEQSPTLAQNLVNWVRGLEDPTDYRSRTTTLTGVTATYRLGDIIDSSPVIVSTPAESFDLLYSDYSYAAFRTNYRNRRQMVYVGANDGMLHAFNGGFYVPGQAAVGTTAAIDPIDYRQLPSGLTSGDSSATQGNNWALGQEAWAFVPDNLLPHLRWMADKNYTHVFYVDGTPVVSDVQEWGAGSSTGCQSGTPAASDIDAHGHVCGWGTVMVVPFRLGGGPINVDTVGNGSETGAAANTQTSNSAYVILDITDPEVPPTVLAEITTGTYTTSAPAFAVHREHTDGKLHFLLTIGSGPADNGGPIATSTGSTSSGTSSEPVSAPVAGSLSVQIYDIASIVANSSTPAISFTSGPAKSFAGDMVAADFNLNYSAEAVYFGVVTNPPPASTPPAAPVPQVYGGGLWKIDMNTGPATNSDGSANPADTSDPSSWTLTQVINTGQPVTIRPSVAMDSTGRPMIYFGTGRAYTTTDDSGTSDAGTQLQDIYGVSDNSLLTGLASACQVMPSTSSLFDAASVDVGTTGAVTGLPATGYSGVSTLSSLESVLIGKVATGANAGCYAYSGWYLPLASGNSTSSVAQPSERVISSQTLLAGVLLTPTYVPPNAAQIAADDSTSCNPIPVPGTSNLYGLDYLTGTATTSLAASFGGTTAAIVSFISLGSGMASSPVLHSSGGHVTAAFGISGGTELQSIGTLSGAANGEISWREPVENQ